ncbi:hypothetical protein BH11MYX2_BH11MYX2_34370 [soil metagenome]
MPADFSAPDGEAYADCVQASERVRWRIDDVLPIDRTLDFALPFLPDSLVHLATASLPLNHRLTLNHIRAHSYVNLFVFFEEYIVLTAMRHAHAEQFGQPMALRALLRFAEEEVKHQQLFRRFKETFRRGFGHDCDVIDNAAEVAGYILTKSALAVMLVTLHLELITQQHYVSAIKVSPGELDASFRSLFEAHWLEESQHARIDALEIARLSVTSSDADIQRAFDEYSDILHNLDQLLLRQATLDLDTLERITGEPIRDRAMLLTRQHDSYRQDFLHDGFENQQLVRTMSRLLGDTGAAQLRALAQKYLT